MHAQPKIRMFEMRNIAKKLACQLNAVALYTTHITK